VGVGSTETMWCLSKKGISIWKDNVKQLMKSTTINRVKGPPNCCVFYTTNLIKVVNVNLSVILNKIMFTSKHHTMFKHAKNLPSCQKLA